MRTVFCITFTAVFPPLLMIVGWGFQLDNEETSEKEGRPISSVPLRAYRSRTSILVYLVLNFGLLLLEGYNLYWFFGYLNAWVIGAWLWELTKSGWWWRAMLKGVMVGAAVSFWLLIVLVMFSVMYVTVVAIWELLVAKPGQTIRGKVGDQPVTLEQDEIGEEQDEEQDDVSKVMESDEGERLPLLTPHDRNSGDDLV
jgi:hypothetical protein